MEIFYTRAVNYILFRFLISGKEVKVPMQEDQKCGVRQTTESKSATPLDNRTLFNIIWSCVSTTICAWTSVHPNVPPLNKWKARWDIKEIPTYVPSFVLFVVIPIYIAYTIMFPFLAITILPSFIYREEQYTNAY